MDVRAAAMNSIKMMFSEGKQDPRNADAFAATVDGLISRTKGWPKEEIEALFHACQARAAIVQLATETPDIPIPPALRARTMRVLMSFAMEDLIAGLTLRAVLQGLS